MIGVLPRYNTMKCQLQSMSGTLLGTWYNMSATVQNMNFRYLTNHKMSSTYSAGTHETLRY